MMFDTIMGKLYVAFFLFPTPHNFSRTKNWGNVVGIVTKRRGDKVFVQWEGTSFPIEDEMDISEVKLYPIP